jgi:hypothetical protein
MLEYDDMKFLRDKLSKTEFEAPGFDALFGDEALGDASFRASCQSKLLNHTAPAPDFDQLFAGDIPGKPALTPVFTPKRHVIPIWTVLAAAACFTLFLLLPDRLKSRQETLSLMKQQAEQIQTPIHRKAPVQSIIRRDDRLLTQKIQAPATINTLAIDRKKTTIPDIQYIAVEEEFTEAERDTDNNHILSKIAPSTPINWAVVSKRSVKEAYAEARIRKIRPKRDKASLGASFNSANRLLALVNTNSNSDLALQSATDADGYTKLEGSTSLLRTATSSRNAWNEVENIPSSTLQNFETTYALPINFGLTVSIPLFPGVEIISGLSYTFMSGKTSGNNTNGTFELKQQLHYIGIPLKVSVHLLKRGAFGAYLAAGGAIEKGLAGVQKSRVEYTSGEVDTWEGSQKIYGLQTSLSGQLGVNYELNRLFKLYIEPGAAWYIPNDQPVSSRTEEPFNFNLGLGVRYCL